MVHYGFQLVVAEPASDGGQAERIIEQGLGTSMYAGELY